MVSPNASSISRVRPRVQASYCRARPECGYHITPAAALVGVAFLRDSGAALAPCTAEVGGSSPQLQGSRACAFPYTRDAVNGSLVLLVTMTVALAAVLGGSILLVQAARRAAPMMRLRQQAIAALCAQRGLVPDVAPSDFALLGAIDPRWLTNSFSSRDHGVAAADFIRPAGKNTQFFTILAFTVAGLKLPYLAVSLRNLTGVTLGGPPALELESTEFDRRFTVRSNDRRSAVMLLDPGMMQWLLDCEQVNFDMVGDKVLAFINRAAEPAHRPTEPVEFELLFRFFDGFEARVPALLRSEFAATT